ncbi:Extensin family protein [Methylocella silvestris BL2]|uniref:Extensin family protein n=1 Tax=Methylocella silvestris (strain DSM 15510 / CIP 108128 / LMG 27833 / NCIMB 13906 / BL2) TaxID=395965 RepID=B8EJA5_METSB|nr:extensin family protein [Methylocella silvestris]ACK52597.1 Extensin family protein [Methylocella silvestris BL2]
MARRILLLAFAAALIGSLAGCSNYERARRPVWREQAENACFARRPFELSSYIQPAREISGPGICGLTRPLKVYALDNGTVGFQTGYTLDCPMVASLNEWVREVVQPTAQARFGQRIIEIIGMGSYSCRGINGSAYGRLSEHAFGNALDIGGFRLADGREITVVRDWTRGDEQARAFLQEVHMGACSHFTTVLGPGSNVFHYNHIHVDLAMHGATSTGPRRICKPFLQLNPAVAPPPAAPSDGLPEAPDIDDDLDVAHNNVLKQDAEALQVGPGPGPTARIPDAYFAAAMRPPAAIPTRPAVASAYAPVAPMGRPSSAPPRGELPEGDPSQWDLTSTVAPRR